MENTTSQRKHVSTYANYASKMLVRVYTQNSVHYYYDKI